MNLINQWIVAVVISTGLIWVSAQISVSQSAAYVVITGGR